MKDDDRIWSLPKYLLMAPGESLPKRDRISFMKRYPMAKPKIGDMRSDVRIFTMPLVFRMPRPPCATAAPAIPPKSACEELTGIPMRIVISFQRMADRSADLITVSVTALGS